MTCPCKDCPDRHTDCWSGCKKYKDFRAEVEREKAARHADHNDDLHQLEKIRARRIHKKER